MKTKTVRKEYPKVRQTVKKGNTYYVVDLRRKHYQGPQFKWFNARQPALTYAADVADKVNRNGVASVSVVGVDPRVQAWTEQFAIYNKTLEEGINAALGVFEQERKVKESPYMAELLTVWMDDKLTNTLKPLRERSRQSIRQMANTFKDDFGMIRMKEISTDTIERYLENKAVSNQTRKNLRNYLGQFFNWAIKKSYHKENPVKGVEITVMKSSPKFFTVEQCETILAKSVEHDLESYFALCLFAGIRPKEVERMTWNNVNLATKEIHLTADMTKTKKDRLFTMSDNLAAWLKSLDGTKPLVNPNYKRVKNKVFSSLQRDGIEWIQDGLRHSFATYHYAKHKSLELLRHDMGNSPDIIERFYKGAIPQAEVEKFWGINPSEQ